MTIKELKIYTQNLDQMIAFYGDLMGLDLVKRSTDSAVFLIGKSILKLVEREQFTPYHFAFEIPCNQEVEALEWLKDRVDILKDGGEEIQDFDFWNARAIYFYDSDKNIVEFIARKNLNNERQGDFNTKSILGICEIGMPVQDIQQTFNTLTEISNLRQFSGGMDSFCAIGDEHGLFICINKNVKDWFPTGDKAHASDFEIVFEHQQEQFNLAFINQQLRPMVESL